MPRGNSSAVDFSCTGSGVHIIKYMNKNVPMMRKINTIGTIFII